MTCFKPKASPGTSYPALGMDLGLKFWNPRFVLRTVHYNHWFNTFSSQVGKAPNVPLILHKYLKKAITIDIHTKGAIVFSSFFKITPIAQDIS
ncbi:hypothetical protein FEM48_Zijuj08G0175600 [Ziziphus jujuba var. spinosa]|uniref:Uncharacterized protein n=1 Tax=Ziziphus jujuba var. spinosa TaxID=714518 RepID=A0A978V0F7_ZIZJJ|nr:hypothetical protein FEM48_Zijuj08G0175600 [Ziziphus jujuba var. spinosa]